MTINVPQWVKSAIFYQIFPDRFAKSEQVAKPHNLESWDSPPTALGFKGGDLIGCAEKLDYLVDLGINTIYLNPIFSSTANHRYHTFDFFQIDPILGGNKAFKYFIEESHKKKIRIVIDGVFNHASRGFYQFNHTLENGIHSPYKDWFHFNEDWLKSGRHLNPYDGHDNKTKGFERYGYRCWWNLPALPKFNTHNPDVQKYILDVAKFWIDEGIDGWRLDVPEEIENPDFWQKFRTVVKQANPEAYIVGEIWRECPEYLQGDKFDAVMNYALGKPLLGFFLADTLNRKVLKGMNYEDIKTLDGNAFASHCEKIFKIYPTEISLVQMNLLASHDTPRLLTIASDNFANVKLAMAFMFCMPGAPCFYYGDEIGMTGAHDPECRKAFNWDQSHWNHDLLSYYKKLISLRLSHKALTHGDFCVRYASENQIVIERNFSGEKVIAGFNRANKDCTIQLTKEYRLGPKEWFIEKL